MNPTQRLLREPPEAFRRALAGLHQDINYVLEAGATMAELIAKSAYGVDQKALLKYVDQLLSDRMIDPTDLRALFNRHCSAWGIQTSGARALFEDVRDVLRKELRVND